MSQRPPELDAFSGMVRLFPLPQLVLFPNMVHGFHIFEPRYRQMTADALADDQLIALVLLQPGYEADYFNSPAIYSAGCLGKIVGSKKTGDGRYHLDLRGLSRYRIRKEIAVPGKLYRCAEVDLLDEVPVANDKKQEAYQKELLDILTGWCGPKAKLLGMPVDVFNAVLPLGLIIDIATYLLPLPLAFKQEMLETPAVEERAEKLLAILEKNRPASAPGKHPSYPTKFSEN
ncbi:MAG: ATP-dependent protease [Gemmatales bacterium]|nr:MAG: ATP-dependent protease [Gemmatales bacterium]